MAIHLACIECEGKAKRYRVSNAAGELCIQTLCPKHANALRRAGYRVIEMEMPT